MDERRLAADLAARGIRDLRVLEAFAAVPRHLFVPEKFRARSYSDRPLPIGFGQTISQPYIVAVMTELLGLTPQARALDVGTGSGYHAAILAQLAGTVYSVERVPELAESAAATLSRLGVANVQVKIGDGSLGWPEEAPFDAILVTAAAPQIPPPLLEQLKEGGRLIAPVGSEVDQTLTLATRTPEGIVAKPICGCMFVPLIGQYGYKAQ